MTDHPTDVLVQEHDTILAVLAAMEAEAKGAADTARQPFWDQVLRFLGEFADQRHHGKEEDLLFPAMEAAGLPPQGPTAVMRQEHVEGRGLRSRMQEALAGGDTEALYAAAQAFVMLLREHIDKENMILFPMARELVRGPAAAELDQRFAAVEQDYAGSDHAALLEAITAVPDKP